MTPKLEEALLALASKLGTTTEHLWGVLVKQALVIACVRLILQFAIIAVAVVLIRELFERVAKLGDKSWGDREMLLFGGALLFTLVSIPSIACLPTTFAAILVPEGRALQGILSMLR